jgi:hypothetical protein
MGYLLPSEYEQFGLPAETTDDWVTMASVLMENYCHRPSLLATQYVERTRFSANSQTAMPSYNPLVTVAPNMSPIVGVRVRYAQPRHGELQDPFLAQVAWAFSIPGSWSDLDPSTVDINYQTGEFSLPRNYLGIGYNEVEITYTAGFITVPDAVKVACAQLVKNAQATPAMNVRSNKIDTMQMQYFSSSIIDTQIQSLLRPYLAQRIG